MAEANSVSADGAFYDKMGEDYQHAFTHDEVLQESVQQFLDLLPKTASILDCGSGTGKPVAELMANSGRTVYGIDQSPGMVALSKKQVPTGHFELQNMLTYDPSVQFDGVVASLSMFEHSRGNVEAMTQNFSEWLRPGGHLLIATFPAEEARQATPETYDPDGQCAQKIPWRFMGNKVEITLFTKDGWRLLLQKNDLRIVKDLSGMFNPLGESDPEPRWHFIAVKDVGAT